MASQVEDIKWLPCAATGDKRFLVDGFAFKTRACRHYILTHFHSDHTIGLNKGLAEYGVVYTSEVTARLLVHDMGFPASAIVPVPLHTPFMLEGCRVTLLDANHCPGAVMLLVEVLQDITGAPMAKPQVILHTGDCRWEDRLASHIPAGLRIDTLYLDTTYCIPRYTFPVQAAVIDELCMEVKQLLETQPRSLLVVAAYHIGKEKVFMGVAQQLGLKVWCTERKRGTLAQLGLPAEQMQLLTDNPQEAQLHVSAWGGMRPDQIRQRYLGDLPAEGQQQETTEGGAAGADEGDVDDDVGAELAGLGVQIKEEGGAALPTGPDASEEANAAAAVKGQCGWTHVIGIRATGWSFRKKAKDLISRWVSGPVTLLSAPYSEHSSYAELCSCVRLLRPSRIIPTANAPTAAAAKAIVERFIPLMDLSKQRGRMDMYLRKAASTPTLPACHAALNSMQPGSLTPKHSAPVLTPSISPAQVVTIDLTIEEEGEDSGSKVLQQEAQHVCHGRTASEQNQLHINVATESGPMQQPADLHGGSRGGPQQQIRPEIASHREVLNQQGAHAVPSQAPQQGKDEQDRCCQPQPQPHDADMKYEGMQFMEHHEQHQPCQEGCCTAGACTPSEQGPLIPTCQGTISSPAAGGGGMGQDCMVTQHLDAPKEVVGEGLKAGVRKELGEELGEGLSGVDAREQQRIWDSIQVQLQQEQRCNTGGSKAGPAGARPSRGKRAGNDSSPSGAGAKAKPGRQASAGQKSVVPAADCSNADMPPPAAKRARKRPSGTNSAGNQSSDVGPSGSRNDPVVLDGLDLSAGATGAAGMDQQAGSPASEGGRKLTGSGAGGTTKQSSIRAFFSPTSAKSL